jgi:hypothetical protein
MTKDLVPGRGQSLDAAEIRKCLMRTVRRLGA